MLERCLLLAPGIAMSRQNDALVLDRCNRRDAPVHVVGLLAADEDKVGLQNFEAVMPGMLRAAAARAGCSISS